MPNAEEPRPSTRLQDLVSQHLQPQQGEPESFCMTKCKHVMPKKYGVKGFIVDLVSLQLRSDLKQLQDKLAKERPQLFLVCNQQNASKLDQEILRPGNIVKILDPVFMNQFQEKSLESISQTIQQIGKGANRRAARRPAQTLELEYVHEMYVPVFAT